MQRNVQGGAAGHDGGRPTFTPPWTLSHGGQRDRLSFASLDEAVAEAARITRSNTNAVLVRDSATDGARIALLVRLQEA